MQKDYDVTINWRGFELHPEIPVDGMKVEEYFPKDRIKGMHEYLSKFAKQFGVDITFTDHMPNTRKALAMAEYAREQGVLESFKTGAMLAYWNKGADLEDEAVLSSVAINAGLAPDKALEASEESEYLQRIDTVRTEANGRGVTGIPTMVMGGEKVVGCQSYEAIVAAGKRAGIQEIDRKK